MLQTKILVGKGGEKEGRERGREFETLAADLRGSWAHNAEAILRSTLRTARCLAFYSRK